MKDEENGRVKTRGDLDPVQTMLVNGDRGRAGRKDVGIQVNPSGPRWVLNAKTRRRRGGQG